ncbi:MAG: hypothetical protein FWC29_01380 [Methanomassiliicoccaceae archaeon]|nr:hypothetical protein [Methanomassiliicoccaceae archaeon]
MDKEKTLREIQSNIKNGNMPLASGQILELANQFSDDPFTLLTCASLLKVIEDEKSAADLARVIPDKVEDKDRLEAAKGLRSIGFPAEAEKVLSHAMDSDDILREKMHIFFDLRMYKESSGSYEQLASPTLDDTAVMIRSVSAGKEHDRAVKLAEGLLSEAPDDLNVKVCYCAALSAAGRSKEAGKFVKENLKKSKSKPDADALVSYYLWIEGKTVSAGAYASKAVKGDPSNILGMEILAYSLVEKKKINEAKIVAGAINEKEPGNPAVVRILDMCRNAR